MKTIRWTQTILGVLLATCWVATNTVASQTVLLRHREVPYAVWQVGTVSLPDRSDLKQQPDFGGRPVLRGRVDFFGDPTNVVACVWDYSERKLYLDLNRNLDLTDDPDGVIPAAESRDAEQRFAGIQLTLRTTSGAHVCRVAVSLVRSGTSGHGTMSLHSFWEGQAMIGGQACQLGLLEVLAPFRGGSDRDFLLVRPWSEREVAFSLTEGTPDSCYFPRRLFYLGAAMAVKGQFTNDAGQEVFRLELQDETPDSGELELTGSHVRRLILEDAGGYTAVIDDPTTRLRVPVGRYQVSEVWLRQGTTQAVSTSRRQVEVRANGVTPLAAGGPLTNVVVVERRYDTLEFNYTLRGVDGEAYRLQPEQRDRPPTYTVQRSGRQVAGGQFAFG